MTRPSRRSRSPERVAAAGVLVLAVVALLALEGRARAQACCAGGAVVAPTRLAVHEDAAVGIQMRARSNTGSFDSGGRYAASPGLEQILEQDLAASVRFAGRGQAGALVPFVQTHRSAGPLEDWGGGLGDVAV